MIKFTGNGTDVVYAGFINYKSIYNDYQPNLSNTPVYVCCAGDKCYTCLVFINYNGTVIDPSIEVFGMRDSVKQKDVNIYLYNDKNNYRILIGVKYKGDIYMDGISVTAMTPLTHDYGVKPIELFNTLRLNSVNITQRNVLYGAKEVVVPFNDSSCCGIVIYTDTSYSTVKLGVFSKINDGILTSTNDFTCTKDGTNVKITFANNVGFEVLLLA